MTKNPKLCVKLLRVWEIATHLSKKSSQVAYSLLIHAFFFGSTLAQELLSGISINLPSVGTQPIKCCEEDEYFENESGGGFAEEEHLSKRS